jgi:hypothetical protein
LTEVSEEARGSEYGEGPRGGGKRTRDARKCIVENGKWKMENGTKGMCHAETPSTRRKAYKNNKKTRKTTNGGNFTEANEGNEEKTNETAGKTAKHGYKT